VPGVLAEPPPLPSEGTEGDLPSSPKPSVVGPGLAALPVLAREDQERFIPSLEKPAAKASYQYAASHQPPRLPSSEEDRPLPGYRNGSGKASRSSYHDPIHENDLSPRWFGGSVSL